MRILIYGSTKLTELCCKKIIESKRYEIVGYIENIREPLVRGNMGFIKKIENQEDVEFDIFLSIQYDKIIEKTEKGYNLHTGLLPEWGGRDIFLYTIKEKAKEQGLTFHKMVKKLDSGPIISKISYPVSRFDDESDLYDRQLFIAPNFIISCLILLEKINSKIINEINQIKPRIFVKNSFPLDMSDHYKFISNKIKEKWS